MASVTRHPMSAKGVGRSPGVAAFRRGARSALGLHGSQKVVALYTKVCQRNIFLAKAATACRPSLGSSQSEPDPR